MQGEWMKLNLCRRDRESDGNNVPRSNDGDSGPWAERRRGRTRRRREGRKTCLLSDQRKKGREVKPKRRRDPERTALKTWPSAPWTRTETELMRDCPSLAFPLPLTLPTLLARSSCFRPAPSLSRNVSSRLTLRIIFVLWGPRQRGTPRSFA